MQPSTPTLLDALDDPTLFLPFFPSPAWDRWRVFCRALTGLPIPEAGMPLFQACTGRQSEPDGPAREAWVVCGRRAGKTRIVSAIAAYTAALAPTDMLAPGEVGRVLVVAADRAQAGICLGYIKALFREVEALQPLVINETADAIDLRHGVRVEVKAGNYRSVRGGTLLAAILDEVAFFRDEESAIPDVELVRALQPSLATTHGLLIGISSPWAQRGVLWTKYRKHFGKDGAVLVWQSDSRTMHPGLDAELIAEALEDDPESAASEWGGAFRSDLESYVGTKVIDAVTTPGVDERPPAPGVSYHAFLDAAAGSGRDSFTAAVAHVEDLPGGGSLVVLDAVREIRPPFDPHAITGELAGFLKAYSIREAQSDKYAGAWVVEAFRHWNVWVEQTAEPKSVLYLSALPILTSHRADLLDLPRLRTQLIGLERRRRSGGRDIVDHPPGGHDDVANAVCGALVLAEASIGDGAVPVVRRWTDPETGAPAVTVAEQWEAEMVAETGYPEFNRGPNHRGCDEPWFVDLPSSPFAASNSRFGRSR